MSDLPPVRAITQGPKYHWFGYYDKLQFCPANRRVLGMEVDFEHRQPRAEDEIGLGMVDLAEGDRWIELGRTRAWCWQQGCMLQWRPGTTSQVVWNDRQDDRFVAHVMDVETGQRRTLSQAVYTLSPDGRWAVGADFRRINDMRPGYGYAGIPDPNAGDLAPENAGVWRIDLDSGASQLIVSIAQVAALPYPHGDLSAAKHYFNHLLFSPDGSRFIFLHRWRFGEGGFHTRMLTAGLDGSDIRVVDDYGHTSHFIWRDPAHILAWSWHPSHENKFYLYGDGDGHVEMVGEGIMEYNGHCTYLPGDRWILNDTYPLGPERIQELYMYEVASRRRVELGAWPAPAPYTGEWRCDLHPRFSREGRLVTVDSTHAGGRQIYLVDIEAIIP
ncbi:MAG: hypothetical protein GKR89_07820 [Candidatus Latescibacteria bacterium]|nr:hypothetical protein [Candidatus Latescibacterota bacterium]